MKLRQKLAVVLASAMVLTAVPVVTMAASSSYTSKVVVAAKDAKFTTDLVIDVKDTTTSSAVQVVYLEMTGAKFVAADDSTTDTDYSNVDLAGTGITSISRESDTVLKVVLDETVKKGKIYVPIIAKSLSADEVTVAIDGDGTKAIDNATVIVAKKSDSKSTVKAADAKKIDGEGTVADITIEEPFKNVMSHSTDVKTITLTLDNSNYKFTNAGTVTPGKGFTGVSGFDSDIKTGDNQVIEITVPAGLDEESLGNIKISGIQVKCLDKNAPAEEVKITVDGYNVTETTVTVAKVTDYAGELVLSDKAVDITAGQNKSVKIKLKETLAGSFINDKEVEFTIDKGYLTATPGGVKDADGFYTDGIYKDEKNKKATELIGFTYTVDIDDSTKALSEEFELKLGTKLDETGDITVTASGKRAIGDDLSLVVANVTSAIEVKATPMIAKSGIKDQKGGTLVITETAKGNIKSGETFQITLKDGVTFSDKPEFKVTEGDLIIEKIEVDKTTKSVLNVTVKRASKTASTLEITNFAINSDRTIADGGYDVELSGAALTKAGKLKVEDFLKVGEKTSAVSSFTIGESYYLVDGVKVEMDAAPYIEDGRTMVPVKYVAAALGLNGNDIVWDQANRTVTVFADRTVQLKANSNVAVVNGASMTIDGKVVVKDGRTYVPVSQLGNLLGVKATWDAATKTATFQN